MAPPKKRTNPKMTKKYLTASNAVTAAKVAGVAGVATTAAVLGPATVGALVVAGGAYTAYETYKGYKSLGESRIRRADWAARAKLAEEYRTGIGFGKDANFSSNAFQDLMKNKARDFHVFTSAKTNDGSLVRDKLNISLPTNANAKLIKERISTILDPNKLKNAQTKFEEDIAAFTDLVKEKVPSVYSVEQIIDFYYRKKFEAREAIQAEFDKEVKNLTEEFDNQNFRAAIQAEAAPNDYNAFKDSMLADLKKSQTDQLAAFDKSVGETIDQLANSASKELDQSIFIGVLKEMGIKKKEIEDLERKRDAERAAALNQTVQAGALLGNDVGKVTVGGIDPAVFDSIKTLSGKTIQRNPDGSCSIEYGQYLYSPLYWLSPHKNEEYDLLMLALLVKTSGAKSILMTINAPIPPATEEKAKEHARRAFEACLNAGFPKDKITINLNGKDLVYAVTEDNKQMGSILNELYEGRAKEFQVLIQTSEKNLEKYDTIHKSKEKLEEVVKDRERFLNMEKDIDKFKALKAQAATQRQTQEGNAPAEEPPIPTAFPAASPSVSGSG